MATSTTTNAAYGKVIKQEEIVIPDLSVKDLLSAIPYVSQSWNECIELNILYRAHCFKRSALRSGSYV
jgi:hypothetical protein